MKHLSSLTQWPAFLAICALLINPCQAESTEHWAQQRAQAREQRLQLQAQATEDIARRAKVASGAIEQLLAAAEKQRVPGQVETIGQLITGLEQLDEPMATSLRQRLSKLPPAPDKVRSSATRRWQRALKKGKKTILERTGSLLNRAIQLGINDLAHEFLHEILRFDPDNKGIRSGLGQVKVHDRWLSPHAQRMTKNGLWWDEHIGWIIAKDQERYAKGDYFDLQSKTWTTLEAANKERSQLGKNWVITTRNVTLHTTLDLHDAIRMSHYLDNFYQHVFAAYANFFATGSSDYQLVLGLREHPPLTVWIYRTKEQFAEHALSQVTMPEWTAGFWSPRLESSFFYYESDRNLRTLFHEFTHQMFYIFAQKNRAPTWLTEGLAVYNETVEIGDNKLILGNPDRSRRLKRHWANAQQNTHTPIQELLRMSSQEWKSASGDKVGKNYSAAGSLAWYCMEFEERRYRSDFIDFIRDSYLGTTEGRDLFAYLGVDERLFLNAYQAWEKAPK